ncbi:hypothetical protein Tco_1206010 [Tanacetum coccineum]
MGKGGSVAPRKKRVHKNQEPVGSGSERTISPTLLHHAALMNVGETTIAVLNDTAGNATDFEKEVVDLSAHSFHSTHHEDTKEDVIDHQFVPNWRLCADLCICTFRAYKELVSHLATPAEEKFWGSLSNVEVVALVAKLARAEMDTVVRKLYMSVEYQKSLATPVSLCFTAGWLGGLSLGINEEQISTKVADSYRLHVDALTKVSPDIPCSATKDRARSSTTDDTGDVA